MYLLVGDGYWMKNHPTSWNITACSPLKFNRCFGGILGEYVKHDASFALVSCWTYSSTLKVEALRTSETSIEFIEVIPF
jgi:hypothetical protein